ncbi:hypothetical protein OY671_009943, partial [Metschnikowia pulcherrima]
MKESNRVILGTDAPAGSGVQPLGISRMVSSSSALGDVPAEIAFCFATGNTARMRALDCGIIEPEKTFWRAFNSAICPASACSGTASPARYAATPAAARGGLDGVRFIRRRGGGRRRPAA